MTTFVIAKNNPVCQGCAYKKAQPYAKCDIRKHLPEIKNDIADAYIRQKPMPKIPNCIDEAITGKQISKLGQFMNKHSILAKIIEQFKGPIYR